MADRYDTESILHGFFWLSLALAKKYRAVHKRKGRSVGPGLLLFSRVPKDQAA